MNPEKKRKLKTNAYYVSLAIVLCFVVVGFYMKQKDPEPAKQEVVLSTDSSLTVKEGDQVNIDFVGYMDGEEMKSGSTKDLGMDITVGSGRLMTEIEEQLIGHHPGENYRMTVTFPEDYKDKDLRGKEASIDMTIHGIYVVEEENKE